MLNDKVFLAFIYSVYMIRLVVVFRSFKVNNHTFNWTQIRKLCTICQQIHPSNPLLSKSEPWKIEYHLTKSVSAQWVQFMYGTAQQRADHNALTYYYDLPLYNLA